MSEQLIQDIPSIKKAIEKVQHFKAFKQSMPILRPIFRIFNVDVEQIDEVLTRSDELEKMVQDITTVPDRFNDIFAELGWIVYERMSLDVAKAAVDKAEAGDIAGAEVDLVDYYNDAHVAFSLRTMMAVQAFRPRMSLAEKALIDYREERYHACVPVVLALLDGMVNDLHEKQFGFFTKDTSLSAWDSIAAHSKGLDALNRILQKSRQRTVTEKISIPYRHGILHGRDLGYDNRLVAAKCWAALFAAREWALKAEKGELTAPPEEPEKTWKDYFNQIRENQRQKEHREKWQPRNIRVSKDVFGMGTPDIYEGGTPERRLVEYLSAWSRRNYGLMAKCVPNPRRISEKAMAGDVRARLAHLTLRSFELTDIRDVAAAVTEISAMLVFESNGREESQNFTFRLFNQNGEGRAVIRGQPDGEWVVNNWSHIQ